MRPFPNLNSCGIYAVDMPDRYLLYAPLAGVIADVDPDEMCGFENTLGNGQIPEEITSMLDCHIDSVTYSPDEINELTVLINQRCNFSCKYCYSANGRSNAELPQKLFKPLVDWYVRKERLSATGSEMLSVTFSGGGDPTLSFDKVRTLIMMFRSRATDINVDISFNMVCNGSRIRKKDIPFIRENIDNIVISFDVIPEVHNAQRSHYDTVAETMRLLTDNGIRYGLRSTITSLNVERMEEMIETLHKDFPECKSLAAEVVLSPDMWRSSSQLEMFHDKFVHNFFKAQKLADHYGISFGNTIELSSDGLKVRACEGKAVVTPEGKLTACSRVATPGDNYYDSFLFGEISEEGVHYDVDKYKQIMSVRADNIDECHSCFARYHCGGGCMLARLSYTAEQMKLHCDLTRQILKRKLFDELDK